MFEIVAFKKEHLKMMEKADSAAMRYLTEIDAECLEGNLSFTAMVDGVPVCSAGVVEVWTGRFMAWAHISPKAYKYWKSIHKAVVKFLDDLNARRVEAEVEKDFAAGRHWMKRLGFKCETPNGMARFFPDGRDAVLYARVKKVRA